MSRTRYSFRKHDWLNTKTNKPVFGIQARPRDTRSNWKHLMQDGVPALYDLESERDAVLSALRKEQRAKNK